MRWFVVEGHRGVIDFLDDDEWVSCGCLTRRTAERMARLVGDPDHGGWARAVRRSVWNLEH